MINHVLNLLTRVIILELEFASSIVIKSSFIMTEVNGNLLFALLALAKIQVFWLLPMTFLCVSRLCVTPPIFLLILQLSYTITMREPLKYKLKVRARLWIILGLAFRSLIKSLICENMCRSRPGCSGPPLQYGGQRNEPTAEPRHTHEHPTQQLPCPCTRFPPMDHSFRAQ